MTNDLDERSHCRKLQNILQHLSIYFAPLYKHVIINVYAMTTQNGGEKRALHSGLWQELLFKHASSLFQKKKIPKGGHAKEY